MTPLLDEAGKEFLKYGIVGALVVVEAIILYVIGKRYLSGLEQEKARLLAENKKLLDERTLERAETVKLMFEVNATLGKATRALARRTEEP